MGFKEVATLDSDVQIALGGVNKKTGKANPTKIEGYFLGSKEVESKKSKTGTCLIHFFQTPKGSVGVWGKTNLDQKLSAVAPGTMTRATFTGYKPCPGKNDMYVYKVETDTENVIEVAGTDSAASTDTAYNTDNVSDDSDAYDPGADVDADSPPADEPPPARATRPVQAAPAPSAAQQKKVQDILKNARARTQA